MTKIAQAASVAENTAPDAVGLVARSPFFDAAWYVANNHSVMIAGFDPALHYLRVGADLGRDPGPLFTTEGYLAANPDVRASGLNPLLHFEKYGRHDGRSPVPHGRRPVAPQRAVAASKAVTRGWRLTRAEAEGVMHATLCRPDVPATAPRRKQPVFDMTAARRYAAAAETVYDSGCRALKATVIMPTFNRGKQISEAVRSVLQQSHRHLELLIVDDGSTDDTRARIDRFAGDQRVRTFWNDHGGVSAARNTGLRNATGDYVFYLDSDNTWTPDHVKLMLAGLQATGADCAYSASCVLDENSALEGYRGEPFDWDACLKANYVDMNVMAHRIALFEECGGFDEDLRRMVDWDLILRFTKGREVAFLPYIGCLYRDHTGDETRISVSRPYLYRKIVAEKNRQGLACVADTLDTLKLSFGIKIAAPEHMRAEWGDFHYADSLAQALRRLGHAARIDFRGQWESDAAAKDDVALVLRGLTGHVPRPSQLTLVWNISHPDQVSYDEFAAYDRILVASRSYAALLSLILERPVQPLLQCTDTTRFNLPAGSPPVAEDAPGLFVGNSRNEYRQMVRWSVENDVPIDIYGTRWQQFLPRRRIAGENVANTRLVQKYREAGFALNDHWQSMKDFGFVSNRVFDVVASGGRLISDRLPSLETIFGDAVETVEDEAAFLGAVARGPLEPERRARAADYVKAHHSFDARARAIKDAVKCAMTPAVPEPAAAPDLAPGPQRRTVGLLMQRGRSWWTSSAYIRLIGPLTTDYAHSIKGIDLVALGGPDDPRIETCDICIVQRVAVPDADAAGRLVEKLRARQIPLYVDTDDAFFLHDDYRAADTALRLLMGAAREVWFSTEALAELYGDISAGKSRVRRNDLDPRFWRDYRHAPRTTFDDGPVRFVYMGTATHHGDLQMVLPAFERLARDRSGSFELSLVGVTSTPPAAEWLRVRNPPRRSGGYPAFARFVTREMSFDVGIAPLVPSSFNAAKSDVKFLDYSAMGLLSVVSDGPVYRQAIEAGLAVGCANDLEAWYATLAAIVDGRENFAAMRAQAAARLWNERNVLDDPAPLADLVV